MKLTRKCPQCSKELTYARKQGYDNACKKNSLCISCVNSNRATNPTFREKARQAALRRVFTESEKEQARQQLKRVTNNKPVYDIWLEKYGQEEADRLDLLRKAKWSAHSTGNKNPMYGKPAPQGSGNGWSGWYKGFYFRSLYELGCILNFEKENVSFKTAETKKFKIPYIDALGTRRNYYADFITSTGLLVECKPTRLWNTPSVKAKQSAAEVWCTQRNLKYVLVDYGKPSIDIIKKLLAQGLLVFIKRYQLKFKEKYQ
jgi:hypothetical protein